MAATDLATTDPDARPTSEAGVMEYVFPALRGIQAGRVFYASMCPMRLIPRIFLFDEEELIPEMRAQRVLNRARVPEIARYILSNRDSYVFSALTASIDADTRFEPLDDERVGRLRVPMSARFVVNDGQHRRAAIEAALREDPSLGDESIAVVFFLDVGLDRSQQMFADLNRYAIRPSRSLGLLYDHRDDSAELVRQVVLDCAAFRGVVEMERSTLSPRSRKLFTLSAIYGATRELLVGFDDRAIEERTRLAVNYWEAVAPYFPEWTAVQQTRITAGEVRRDFIHSHGIVLTALGRIGNTLLRKGEDPGSWSRTLRKLPTIDWGRSNASLWEGRAMIGGRVSKNAQNVSLTTSAVRTHVGLPLSPEEQRIEDAFRRGE